MAILSGSRSRFKEDNDFEFDEIKELYDISPSKIHDANRLRELKLKQNPNQSEQEEIRRLTASLDEYIITAERWNLFGDVIVNMQKFYKTNVIEVVNKKKQEIENEVNRFTQSLENKEQEVVNNIRQFTNEKTQEVKTFTEEKKQEVTQFATEKTQAVNSLVSTKSQEVTDLVKNKSKELTDLIQNKTQEVTTHVRDKKQEMEQFVTEKKDGLTNTISQKEQQFNQEMAKFTDKGEYNPSTQYHAKNMIRFEGNVYLCIKDALGKHPTNSEYWTKLSIKGDTGYAVGLNPKGAFNIGTQYRENDLVQYEGSLYRAKQNVRGVYPTNTQNWEVFLSGNGERLSELQTEHKLSLVGAINENNTLIKTNLNTGTDNRQKIEDVVKKHTALEGRVTKFGQQLNNKANVSHTHSTSDITGLDNTINQALDATSMLNKLKTVDGANSGLDADLVKGVNLSPITQDFDEFAKHLSVEKLRIAEGYIESNKEIAFANSNSVLVNTTGTAIEAIKGLNELAVKYKQDLKGIKSNPDAKITFGWDNNPNGKVNINMLRHHFESYPTRVTGDASSPNTIKVKIPIGLKDLTKDIHISGKIMFFHEDFPIVGGNPRPTILNQPLVIDFSVICQSKTRVIGGHFMCEHKKIRPELYVPHDGITDDKLTLFVKIDSSQLALMKSRSLLATFDLLAHSDGDKIQIQNQYKYNNNYSFDAECLNLSSGFFNGNYSHPLEDCSLFRLSVDGKKKIVNAINGKNLHKTIANESMSWDELYEKIWDIQIYRAQTHGNIKFNTNNLYNFQNFIKDNKKIMEILPHIFDTSIYSNMDRLFYECYQLMFIPLLDTSNVVSMKEMFYLCSSLNEVPLLDTSKVTNMEGMFRNCNSLKTIPQFNTINVTTMKNMFGYCYTLKTIPLLDTRNVTDMSKMFNTCLSLKFVPKLNTSRVTSFSDIFNGCTSLDIPRMRQAGWEEKFLQTAPNYTAP